MLTKLNNRCQLRQIVIGRKTFDFNIGARNNAFMPTKGNADQL